LISPQIVLSSEIDILKKEKFLKAGADQYILQIIMAVTLLEANQRKRKYTKRDNTL
jgi:hypothetical protein